MQLQDLWGAGIDGGNVGSPFGQGGAKFLFNAMMNPTFYQAWNALSDAGMDPMQEMSQFVVEGKGAKKTAKGQPGYIPIGGGKFLNVGQLSGKLPDYKAQAQTANTKAAQATYDKLLETPAYATLAKQAKGEFSDDYMSAVNKNFGAMAAGALGSAASQGFINDTSKQVAAVLPSSQAKTQYLTNAQQSAQGYLQNLAGFGGVPGQSAFALSGLGPPSSYYNPMFAAAGMYTQGQQYNAGMNFNTGVYNNQIAMSLFDKAMAAAAGGMGGGMGGWGSGSSAGLGYGGSQMQI